VQSDDSFMAGIPNTVRLTAQIVGSIATEDPRLEVGRWSRN
jgi:hypothetical protein